ncbi:lipase/esterase LipG [Pseudoduganella ginsengisoli]|uniref:Alpha/beta fold hydrolase n=1 Tax=Pseudoduganella ginsengisoli TaxID=1462440 RepID=A0A6L6Q592_9BURK|nr:alpha/beta hydrolase [Pseudoduganella ginsengisoli]MTW04860.1 alpha/beta fold hydrolase [Pseudoduganella ginsengisoli]
MPIITANGINIAYETSGNPDGPPVLLIMGLGMQLVSWPMEFVQGLEQQGCFVIRFDNRDSGLSAKFDVAGVPNLPLSYVKSLVGWPLRSAYLLSDMAADARGLLDALDIQQAHLIGASMGGMIAQIFAAQYPQRTLSLTSIMSSSGRRGLPGPTRAARRALMQPPPPGAQRDQLIDHMAQTFRVIGSPGFPMPEKLLRDRIAMSIERSLCPGGVARQLVAIAASGDRSPLLQQIIRPSLIIHGAQDPLVPVACGIDTAKRITGAVLHVIDGMGHDLPPQLIPRFLGLIKPFLFDKIAPHAVAG